MTETPNPHIIDSDTLTGEMRPIRRAVLSLGSNLGERLPASRAPCNAFADTPDVWVTGVSPGLRDRAGGLPARLRELPQRRRAHRHHAGREPPARPGPRDRGRLRPRARRRHRGQRAAHPRRRRDRGGRPPGRRRRACGCRTPAPHERAFVLQPWFDLEPDAVLPDHGPIVELLEQTDRSGLKLREDADAAGPVTGDSRRPLGAPRGPTGHAPEDAPADLAGSLTVWGLVGPGRRLAVPRLRRPRR